MLIAPYRQVTKTFQPSWIGMIKAQYIGHRVFKKDGLIKKYLNHATVKALTPVEQDYLKRQSEFPWRYSYSAIIANRAPIFMKWRTFSSGTLFTYSPSISKTFRRARYLMVQSHWVQWRLLADLRSGHQLPRL